MKSRIRTTALLAVLGLALAPVARSGEGVLEINQTCATATGCFSGDPPGFPVRIDGSAGKSYRLTSDLAVGDADTDGILLDTSRVTLDLNGFSLVVFPLGSGTGNGIVGGGTNGAFAGLARIRNGAIRGARAAAIDLPAATGVRVEDMTIQFNVTAGIRVGDDAQILRNRVLATGTSATTGDAIVTGAGAVVAGNTIRAASGSGIYVGQGAVVEDNTVSEIQRTGIRTGDASTIEGNAIVQASLGQSTTAGLRTGRSSTVRGNTVADGGGTGIQVDAGSTVKSNSVARNGGTGISAFGSGSSFLDNTIDDNGVSGIFAGSGATVRGNSVRSSGLYGISVGAGTAVIGNTVYNNGGLGLHLFPSTSTYRGNTLVGNGNGGADVVGVNLGDNFCSGPGVISSSCP